MSNKKFASELKALHELTSQYVKKLGQKQTIVDLDNSLKNYFNTNDASADILQTNSSATFASPDFLNINGNDDCADIFAAFEKFHTSGNAKLVFPDFSTINDTATDVHIKASLPETLTALDLAKVMTRSAKFDYGDCWSSWSRSQQCRFNYVTTRTRDYLKEVQESLLIKDFGKEDGEAINRVLVSYKSIDRVYKAFPSYIKNIETDPDFEKTIMLSDTAILQQIAEAVKDGNGEGNNVSHIHALLTFQESRRVRPLIDADVVAPYKKALKCLAFLYRKRVFISKLKDQKAAPEGLSLQTNELYKIVTTIKRIEKAISQHEEYDEYAKAKESAKLALKTWNSLIEKHEGLYFGRTNPDEVAGTRIESFFTEVNDYYAQSNDRILALAANINHNYDNLGTVEDYKKHSNKTWFNFKSSYLIGNPTPQNKTDIDLLINKLDAVIRIFATNPSLQAISSQKGKNLTEERQKWVDRKTEVDSLLAQIKIWSENITKSDHPELKGYTLAPNTFPVDKPKLAKVRKVKVAVVGDNDGENATAPSDVNQGNVGDCYFLAAVASMATDDNFFYGKPDSVIQIIHPEKKGRRAGQLKMRKIEYFSVKMYLPLATDAADTKTGRTPVNVLVYPTKQLIGKDQLEYAKKADSGELWVAILEKAFAEIRGGYNNIEGGFPEEGFALLMNKSADDFSRINFDDKSALDALKKELGNESMTTENAITQKLTTAISTKKITLSTPSVSELIAAGATAAPVKSLNGDVSVYLYLNNPSPAPEDQPDIILFGNHAYSIQSGSGGTFTIRNPHGKDDDDTNLEVQQKTVFTLTGAQIFKYFDSAIIL